MREWRQPGWIVQIPRKYILGICLWVGGTSGVRTLGHAHQGSQLVREALLSSLYLNSLFFHMLLVS